MFVALLVLAACTPKPECTEELLCAFGEVCVEGFCEEIPCSTSDQCAMEETCVDRQCVAGCSADKDCYPGDICDPRTQSCEPRGCRDTRLDCGFKEYCNTASGDCYEAGDLYCRECSSDENCGGNGNLCLNFGGGHEYCGVTCESNDDCPSGFGCYPIGDGSGQIFTYQCYTYCWLYDDVDGDFDQSQRPLPIPANPALGAVCPVEAQ